MYFKPHNIIDLLAVYGKSSYFKTVRYFIHSEDLIESFCNNINQDIKLVSGPDILCRTCQYLKHDGTCIDIVDTPTLPMSRNRYNRERDNAILDYLALENDSTVSAKILFQTIFNAFPDIVDICIHEGEDREERIRTSLSTLAVLGFK